MAPEASFAELTLSKLPAAEQRDAGRALRQTVPRSAHREWHPAADRPHPLKLLEQSNQGRLAELIPLRYGRMLQSPFTFLRGSALIMATDLATTPITGIRVQSCGDAHLLNFGGFATPERNFTFDLNDFDETLPAPWEWDVKRLATSVFVSGRDIDLSKEHCYEATLAAVQAYRLKMAIYAEMQTLEVWYDRLDPNFLIEHAPDAATRDRWNQMTAKAFSQTLEQTYQQITTSGHGQPRLVDQPPNLYHPANAEEYFETVQHAFQQYRKSLPPDRQFLLDRYRLVDAAMKVAGVGSVGTRCGVALLLTANQEPLLLQFKEARSSVLEPFVGKNPYSRNSQRIINGQRLMQSASDIFLGWTELHSNGQTPDFYFRQLRDMKTSIKLKGMSSSCLKNYAEICGMGLARAHARSGCPNLISGYLGKRDRFDQAVADFAAAYTNQVKHDHQLLVEAVRSGQIKVQPE